ncbi:MAG: hypothetical protein WA713_20695 [Candidatus Acidiferrales bacterium]
MAAKMFFRLALTFLCASLLAAIQLSSQTRNRKPEEAQARPPLLLRLVISDPTVCVQGNLDLEIELRNISPQRVSVNPKHILYQITFDRDGGARSTTSEDFWKPKVPQMVSLEPGASYRTTVKYKLDDPFFLVAGIYRTHIAYGQFSAASPSSPELYTGVVDSNVVLFEVRNCSAENP